MRFVKYLLYSTAIIFPLGQLVGLTVPAYPEIRIHLLDILVGITVGIWFATAIHIAVAKKEKGLFASSLRKKTGKHKVLKGILLFIGVGFVSLIVNTSNYEFHQVVIGSLYLVRFAVYVGLYYVVRDLLKAKLLNRAKMSFILVTVGVISATFGIMQYFLYPNLRNLKYLGWDPHLYRAFGTFLDPQFLGIILVLTLLLYIKRTPFRLERGPLLKLGVILTLFIIVFLTYSRSSYLALVVALLSMAIFQRKWKKTLLAFVVLAALFAFIPKPSGVAGDFFRRATVNSRIESWRKALTIWQEKPILGVGFNTLRYFKVQPSNSQRLDLLTHSGAGIDNSFLFVLATTGIIGLFAYLNIWRLILISLIKKPSNFATAICITVALFIHALFNNTLFYPWVMWWMWIFYSSSGE